VRIRHRTAPSHGVVGVVSRGGRADARGIRHVVSAAAYAARVARPGAEEPTRVPRRRPTATSNFGAGRRESHDATAFYERFEAPTLSGDDAVVEPYDIVEPFVNGDARHMDAVVDGSVALVVTSPPYFAGKQYEEELERDGVPSSYVEYLQLLTDVFAECARKLEPGGRIAVNVANLGRKPYRSLAADIVRILQDDLRLLLRGEVVWRKGEGAAGSCAWGSFRSAANPVLRDTTERVVIASKGRFDRALSRAERERRGLPSVNTIDADEFMEATLDVWNIEPESARRVAHPAPFPVGLPGRLIDLYTYEHDLVLDPFMGSGSTLVAAKRLNRRFVGYDLDPTYVDIARLRVRDEGAPTATSATAASTTEAEDVQADDFQARATKEGKAAQALAEELLTNTGFKIAAKNSRLRGTGVTINFIATDADDVEWYFDVSGAFTSTRGGLLRTDTVWKTLGRAHVLRTKLNGPLVFLTSHLPKKGSEGDLALRAAAEQGGFFDAIEMRSVEGYERLRKYAAGGHSEVPLSGFLT
jgi:DNA modification methylase